MVEVVGLDPQYLKKITCTNCASILAYARFETRLQNRPVADIPDFQISARVIDCPRCRNEVVIDVESEADQPAPASTIMDALSYPRTSG